MERGEGDLTKQPSKALLSPSVISAAQEISWSIRRCTKPRRTGGKARETLWREGEMRANAQREEERETEGGRERKNESERMNRGEEEGGGESESVSEGVSE
eukprot:6192293-Pleurochrysis_carterae.AAC.3